MKFDVVGLGCSAVDYLGVVRCCPNPGEKIEMVELEKQGGGPVATALVTLSRLGASASYVGTVGSDEGGDFMLKELQREGVDTSGVTVARGARSIFAFCIAEEDTGRRTIFWNGGTCPGLKPEELDRKLILSGKFLHLDGHQIDAAIQAAKWAKASNIKVVLDPDRNPPQMRELVRLTDILIVPVDFARLFTNQKDCSKAAEKLFCLGPEVVVVTLGEKGCFCKSKEGTFSKSAFKVKAVDTTGAGDVFHGAFIYGLLRDWNLEKTAEFSSAVAAIKCTKLGGRAGIPTLQQTMEFLASQSERWF